MVRGVLIDLSGVLYVGEAVLPGAVAALDQLSSAGVPVRFLTNTTRKTRAMILTQLRDFGIAVAEDQIFTPAQAACARLAAEGHAAHLLIHPDLAPDFAACAKDGPVAVVIGDAGPYFDYAGLNAAFRELMRGAPFLALAANRVFRDADGDLSMDAGAFVHALEYASGRTATVLGKPSAEFFAAAAGSMGLPLSDVAMIGDDAEADVAGALAAGAGAAILVRTGKYRPGDETRVSPSPTVVADDIGGAVEFLLAQAEPDPSTATERPFPFR
ncbi:HAD-superfamily subfamily IIA hydrolase, hypothetical 2 [Rhodovulum sp. P5]|uniref:TIGR01458 family HAD-type hydrolase n=1 Tax=Rhodovulum sp. P5 TaxID=1564506 RepID=UPI0009C2871C|nr:TIGR01458 family HAD-type hydrolase [Rhodovulum sp. P5]ARE39405.1 HAD-superfamily subfamily IIA hydrolase, hypothetical 2 [Rhodovulum sp. P5]